MIQSANSPDYQKVIDQVNSEVNAPPYDAEPAQYIPELSKVAPDQFGICLVDNNGEVFGAGDYLTPFSVQSITKVFTLTMVYQHIKRDTWKRVNVEPSGNPFNSMIQLEFEKGIPRNPFINAGALVVTDALISSFDNPKADILQFVREVSGDSSIAVDEDVYRSELSHSDRNRALASFIKSYGNIENDLDQIIDTYCYHCAISMNTLQLAKSFSHFANDGYSIFADRQILEKRNTKRINALMLTCGYYDESGEFAYKVGLPGKSGVGGGAAAVMPGKFSIAAWSPGLGPKGNSVKATKALELITTELGISLF